MTGAGGGTPWPELRELLERALDASAPERARFVEELRRENPARAAELEELLRADARGGSPLDEGAGHLAAALGLAASADPGEAAATGLTGRRLGVWRLGERLGEGGMGTVYAARREAGPFVQEAAVKVLRAVADTPELRARFQRERQLLAALDHPAIARILDGGTSEEGILWFALERVDGGVPITRWAAERSLTPAERIALLLEVCAAVEAAHRRLIVHRDLKPSNILVAPDGRPRLLDFGVAKLLGEDDPTATRTGAQPLTPRYAAPEQILGEPTTTAVDVYALGVVLYELLTGALPHERATSSPAALARQVAHEAVTPPSRRIAAGTRPRRNHRRRLEGDLDAILLRALRAEPEARYPSVTALAADLRAYLDGRPVAARGGERGYRLRKFLRRHRFAAISALAVGLALAAGLLGTLAQARIARAERDRARAEAEKARQVAGFMTRIFQQADPARARGANLTAREVLAAGAARVGAELADQPEIEAALLLAIGGVERDLGSYEEARPRLERALELREELFGGESLETAEALHELAGLDRYLGRLDLARERLDRALRVRVSGLGEDHLDVARTRAQLGVVLRFAGEGDLARAQFVTALAVAAGLGVESDETGRWWNSLGLVEADRGDFAAAEAAYRESLAQLEATAGNDNPLLALPLDNLGMLLRAQERFAEALPLLARARDLVERTWGPDHLQFGTALNSLAALHADLGRPDEALPLFERAARVYGAALGPDHRNVAWPLIGAGDCRLARGEARAALELFRRTVEIRTAALGPEHGEVAQSLGRVGLAEQALGRLDAAERSLRAALELLRRTEERGSTTLGEALVDLAACLEQRRAAGDARALYAEADVIFRAALPEGHSSRTRVTAALARLE